MKLLNLVLCASALSFWQADVVSAAPYVRYEAHSVQGKKAIVSMQKAMVKLKALGCSNPVSWYFQAAIHGVPIPGREGNLVANPLCPMYTTISKKVSSWAKCASHNESGSPSDIHFLPWHALYLAHFEKIIRKYSGDTKFAIPYWDYEKYPTLPEAFRAQARGSLYEPARLKSLNYGYQIAGWALSTIRQESLSLQSVADYQTFNSQINRGLHDFMHDYIGGTASVYNKVYNEATSAGLMGKVPSAAFDPIFWLHHSNVDRLWKQWIINNPNQNVTLDELNSINWPYRFYNSTGGNFPYTMPKVMAAINTPDYVYDDQLTAKASLGKVDAKRLVEHSIASIPVNVVASHEAMGDVALNISTEKLRLVNKSAQERIILALKAAYVGVPNGRYELYINLPENVVATSEAAKKYFVGAISFFVDDPQGKGGERDFRYDITDELADSKQAMNNFRLTMVKTTGLKQGSVVIKQADVLYLN